MRGRGDAFLLPVVPAAAPDGAHAASSAFLPTVRCGHVTDQAERAREELQRASETAVRDVRLQLQTIDQGLAELVGGDVTKETRPHDDRLRELVEKLDALHDEAEGETRDHIASASELIEDYRTTHLTE